MKTILRLEYAALWLGSIFAFGQLDYAWWLYPALLLLPDLSIAGYALGPRWGAWIYNVFHHLGVGILVGVVGYYEGSGWLQLAGIILVGHSAMDRLFGYGLKLETGFKDTHLGRIG
jgi:hypothetical protein